MSTTTWNTGDIPDQSGRTAVVTGASSGIGLEAARALAGRGCRVVLAVRDPDKGQRAMEAIRKGVPSADLALAPLDLADLASVRAFAEAYLAANDRLDLLVNNAGIMMCPHAETRDGFEIQFGTNHLGHFALTGHLLPLLRRTGGSRVVVVSSLAHRGGSLDFDDLNWRTRKYRTVQAYCDSKLANLYFARTLAAKLRGASDAPLVSAAHPGWSRTDLQRHVWPIRLVGLFMGQTAAEGALPTLRAAVDPEAAPADFYGPAGRREMRGPPVRVEPDARALDEEAGQRLWQLSEEMTGVGY